MVERRFLTWRTMSYLSVRTSISARSATRREKYPTGWSEGDWGLAEPAEDGLGLGEDFSQLVELEGGSVILGLDDPISVQARDVETEAAGRRGQLEGSREEGKDSLEISHEEGLVESLRDRATLASISQKVVHLKLIEDLLDVGLAYLWEVTDELEPKLVEG